MKTEDRQEAPAIFLQRVIAAVSELKANLQRDYERTYPGLEEIIRIVLDEEEANAWKLSIFPHLVLPDLLDAHIEALGLKMAGAITNGAAESDERLAGDFDLPRATQTTMPSEVQPECAANA